ncbi:MAG: hypothetical protein ACP5H5_07640 [Pyrobaculum sp.]
MRHVETSQQEASYISPRARDLSPNNLAWVSVIHMSSNKALP